MATRRSDESLDLWTLSDFNYDWPVSGMRIFRDFTIDDYKADKEKLLREKNAHVEGIVCVQVLNIEGETEKLIRLAKVDSIVKGVVGWVDLTSESVDESLKRLKSESNGLLVGIRHILEGESQDWVVRDDVKRGLKTVAQNGLTYDLLLRPPTLKHAATLASEIPEMTFIIDHISKPRMSREEFDEEWARDLESASKYENVYCKISGLVTEVNDEWTLSHIEPYVIHALKCFGWQRCIFGTDWPVFNEINKCQITDVYEIVNSVVHKQYANETEENLTEILDAIFYANSIKVYKLNQSL